MRDTAPMTPDQLRALAETFERSEPVPRVDQDIAQYQVSLVAHRMAEFLREIADAEVGR